MKRKREEGKDWPRDKVLVLNIGGQKFTLHRDSILAQPNTKLAKMFKAGRLDVNHGDSLDKRQYYFDRPFKFFPIIHKFYQTGLLPLSEIDINSCELWDELAYWEINFPPHVNKMLDFFMDMKENVERYLDGFLLMKKPHENVQDLYFQSFPAELPLYCGIDTIKKVDKEPVWEEMNPRLYSLLERVAKNIDSKKGIKLPLKSYSKIKFLQPFDTPDKYYMENMHPLIHRLYTCIIDNYNELFHFMYGVFPNPLTDIVDDYFYGHFADKEYLRSTYALYSTLIDGAALFDDDKNPYCPFAWAHAIRYLDKKSIKATWERRNVECYDYGVVSAYPLAFDGIKMQPFYRCSHYISEHIHKQHANHSKTSNVLRYLHFEWPLS